MLHLRVFGEQAEMAAVADRLDALPGTRHVSRSESGGRGASVVSADVRPDAADAALALLGRLKVPPDDIALLRFDQIAPVSAEAEPMGLVWADVLGQARVNTRMAVRYLVFMGVAGVIAAFGVMYADQVLIVGAMAVSPDMLPIMSASTGLVTRRWRLAARGFLSLAAGLAMAAATAAAITGILNLLGSLPSEVLHVVGTVGQDHVNAETICVAFVAGIAGMLALETRASVAVGVAISVTTIPASAFLGVAAGVGKLSESLSALGVLAVNVALITAGGSLTLIIQRRLAARQLPAESRG